MISPDCLTSTATMVGWRGSDDPTPSIEIGGTLVTTIASSITSRDWPLVIGAGRMHPAGCATMTIVNPASGTEVGEAFIAGPSEVDAAVAAARAAFPAWWRRGTPARVAAVQRFARMIESHAEELAVLDTLCTGMPITAMRAEMREAVARALRHAHDSYLNLGDSAPASLPGDFHITQREPYGVAAVITPYNHPALFALQAVAAIAVGNTAVLKPPDQAPFSSLLLGELALDCFGPGVLNVITGDGATTGEALVRHRGIDIVSLTGSLTAGQRVLQASAATAVRPVLLELGGKNPIVICGDADIERAAQAAVDGLNLDRCLGQSCTSNSRALVHEQVHDEFVSAVARRFSALRPGNPMDDDCGLGPLVSFTQQASVLARIEEGVAAGAAIVTGGGTYPGTEFAKGAYVEPTLLDQVTSGMTVEQEEIFGPVLSVLTWRTEEQAKAIANGVRYGLTATVFTNSLASAQGFARDLETAMVYVNSPIRFCRGLSPTPFKQSGIGDFPGGGLGDVSRYTRAKAIHIFGSA
jgi:betaine-aldehyde dehydrogenase